MHARTTNFVALFIFLTASLVSADPIATGNSICGPDGQIFDRLLDYRAQAEAVRTTHLSFFRFPSNNRSFHLHAPALAARGNVLFFHVENAVLKLLNDKVIQDKQVSAALLNLYKRVLYDTLRGDPILRDSLIPASEGGVYSDFKSVRLAFTIKDKAQGEKLNDQLNEAYENAARQFEQEVSNYPFLRDMLKDRKDLSGSPIQWHLAGVGTNPEQAALAARRARLASRVPLWGSQNKFIAIQAYGKHFEKAIEADLDGIEDLRMEIKQKFQLILHGRKVVGADGVINREAIDLLRRASSDPTIHNKEQYVAALKERFFLRFNAVVDEATILSLQSYFSKVDRYLPALYVDDSESIHLAEMEGATHGAVTFDMRGAGNSNIRPAMEALEEVASIKRANPEMSSHDVSELLLKKLRRNQDAASEAFTAARDLIHQTLVKSGLATHREKITESGDEVTWLPDLDYSEGKLAKGIATIESQIPLEYGVRLTVQPQNYKGTKISIDSSTRFDWASQMDSMEKEVRLSLEKSFPELAQSGQLEQLTFTMIVEPKDAHTGDLKIWVSSGRDSLISDQLMTRIVSKARESAKLAGNLSVQQVRRLDEVIESSTPSAIILPFANFRRDFPRSSPPTNP